MPIRQDEEVCPWKNCTSCMACYDSCPVGAIHIVTDNEGFYRPRIELNKCIKCGRCKQVCPVYGNIKKFQPEHIIAAYAKNAKVRKESSSGGLFSTIAEYIIEANGIVFGAGYGSDFKIQHMGVETIEDLSMLRTSKYVQSYIGKSYSQVRNFLEDGRIVFFTGTPCQVNGLRQYLHKDYDQLFTADIVCHGTPTSKYFREYILNMEKNSGKKIKEIKFRYKTNDYKLIGDLCLHNIKIMFSDGSSCINNANQDPYLRAFFSDLLLNPACYHCLFSTKERSGDLTIGDFWGFKAPSLRWVNTGKGISLVMVNTQKGKWLLNEVKEKIEFCEKTFEEAAKINYPLVHPTTMGGGSDIYCHFHKDYNTYGYEYVSRKYFAPIPGIRNNAWKKFTKRITPVYFKWILRKIKGKE